MKGDFSLLEVLAIELKILELKSSVLRVPSRNTGQGANCHGKTKPKQGGVEGKPSSRSISEEKRVKVR